MNEDIDYWPTLWADVVGWCYLIKRMSVIRSMPLTAQGLFHC